MDIIFHNDPYGMNWIRPDYSYAQVVCPPRLTVSSDTVREGDEVMTTIAITNPTDRPLSTTQDDISITLPLEDRYIDSARACETLHCSTHVYCGGTSSWVLALRMGGQAPHLGLVLTEGSLASYSIERDVSLKSNDRGCFLLHPTAMEFEPGQTRIISWRIFPCQGKDDFLAQAAARTDFIDASWNRYVLFPGEEAQLDLRLSFVPRNVTVNGQPAEPQGDGACRRFVYRFMASADELGDHEFTIDADGRTSVTRVFVSSPLRELVQSRCRYIVDRQQYVGVDDRLKGALLAYDTEEHHIYYRGSENDGLPVEDYDFNAGRERVGMGVLLGEYLLAVRQGYFKASEDGLETRLVHSLLEYEDFLSRELIDATGHVNGDILGGDGTRFYNAPWVALFYLELHELHLPCGGDSEAADAGGRWLDMAVRIIERFYEDYGFDVYPIELPIEQLCHDLDQAGRIDDVKRVRGLFARHMEVVVRRGGEYPPSEVFFEQVTVGSAAVMLARAARALNDGALADAAKVQLGLLDQFNGIQPDYHLNEVSIRHWDDYWFGKTRMYGDTFPHYWSAVTGCAWADYARCVDGMEAERYDERAEASLRGILPLFRSDGSAGCAYVYPRSVNGERGQFLDVLANDQDWGLFMLLRFLRTR